MEAISSRIKANVIHNLSFAQRDKINARVAGVEGAEELRRPGDALIAYHLNRELLRVPLMQPAAVNWWVKNIKKYIGEFKRAA